MPIVTSCHTAHRVAALQAVGGFAPHEADDLLITYHYRAAGWQGVYVPKISARGLTPVDWGGYLTQQRRWARFVLDIKFKRYPRFAGRLSPTPCLLVACMGCITCRSSRPAWAWGSSGHLLAWHVTAANEQDRAQVEQLAEEVQAVTGDAIEVAFVDQGYTRDQPAKAAAHGMHLEVVKLPEAKKDFVLLPRRWAVERSFAWVARFRRLARDDERLPATLAGLHFLAFVILLLIRVVEMMVQSA